MSIIFRYNVEQNIVERFIGFFLKNKTASSLAGINLSEINKWAIGNKIICQTYDGASVMSGKKVVYNFVNLSKYIIYSLLRISVELGIVT